MRWLVVDRGREDGNDNLLPLLWNFAKFPEDYDPHDKYEDIPSNSLDWQLEEGFAVRQVLIERLFHQISK